MKPAILVSRCLLGDACRYDGTAKPCPAVIALAAHYTLVPVCPESDGGLPTPRPPAERQGDRVVNRAGEDVTAPYARGAGLALAAAQENRVALAVLKSRSPACGRGRIYDGTFTGTLCAGDGVCAARLLAAGIPVFTEDDLAAGVVPLPRCGGISPVVKGK